MSDDNLKEEPLSPEDTRALDLLDTLGPEGDPADRPWIETLGQLPYALEELEPAPRVKRRLLSRIAGAIPEVAPRAIRPAPGRLAALERRARWFMPIAAVLALALLGLTGLQFRQLERQQRTIEELSAQLFRLEQSGAELAEIRRVLDEQQGRMRMMTSRGAEYCVLKPVGESPRFPNATATMVIAPSRDQWYLAAEGLGPCEAGVCYQLWFITEAESVRAASFGATGADQRIELTGNRDGVPEGVRAISITRESETEPPGPPETVLYADQAMTLL